MTQMATNERARLLSCPEKLKTPTSVTLGLRISWRLPDVVEPEEQNAPATNVHRRDARCPAGDPDVDLRRKSELTIAQMLL